ncbi:MAG: polysaccharide biosynthesis C-terminal domain-containing protein [Deltaproteobacteria bacterium]|nr:polysaccharide biosynthesis C-terminal domain-containing protein [Deltaproteobacteria bacterium]
MAMFLQSCYALVNLVFVRMLGDRAVAAHGITLHSFFIILAIGQMIGTTATADISQAYGRGEVPRARGLLSAYTLLAVALGVAASIAAYLLADVYVAFLSDDPDVRPLGLVYFEANAPTFLLQLIIIILAGALRASGDFIAPMRIMIASVLFNAALDPFLIFGIGPFPEMGIAGAAWATVIAQALSVMAYVWLLTGRRQGEGGEHDKRLLFARPAWSRGLFGRIVGRGFPAGLQFFVVYIVTGIVFIGVKPFGADWTGAASGGFRVLQQIWLPIITLSMAAATLAGQNYGARSAERIRETSRTAVRWGLAYGGLATGITIVAAPVLAWLGAESGGTQFEHVVDYLRIGAPVIIAFALTYVPTFILQALGRTTLPLVASLVRVALLAIFTFGVLPSTGLGPEAVLIAMTASAFVEGLIGLAFLRRFNRRLSF